ncbi:MAG: molybdopterin-binding protein [Firmicutes bacterium]|nr:molybdopterin-binding protein [Bacillota bacterium]
MAKIRAVCVSAEKGTEKSPIESAELRVNYGLAGDAHAGTWRRQVSLLDRGSVAKMEAGLGEALPPGVFGENLLIEGLELCALPVGTRLRAGGALLEITQIGKECHSACAIRQRVGDCVMPREGVFAAVLEGGVVRPGDSIAIDVGRDAPGAPLIQTTSTAPYTAAVITVSDKASRGEREDLSGPAVVELLESAGFQVVRTELVPDERDQIAAALIACAEADIALAVTTGGTGFTPRDVTPEATLDVCARLTPGIPETMRAESLKLTHRAILSRQQAGIRGKTWIINLPGSPKAARENLSAVLASIPHGLDMLRGERGEH